MIICDVFSLSLELLGEDKRIVQFTLFSEMPAGSRVIVSFERYYKDLKGEECVWVGFNSTVELVPNIIGDYNGFIDSVSIDESDREAYEEFKLDSSEFSSGIESRVSDILNVSAVVGARQRIKAFGRNNENLSGGMVENSGGINVVRCVESILLPMNEDFQPLY